MKKWAKEKEKIKNNKNLWAIQIHRRIKSNFKFSFPIYDLSRALLQKKHRFLFTTSSLSPRPWAVSSLWRDGSEIVLIINPPLHSSTNTAQTTMSSLPRTIKGFLNLGPGRFFRQLNNIGDTKVGTLIGTDKFGNKYFENFNESYGMADNIHSWHHTYRPSASCVKNAPWSCYFSLPAIYQEVCSATNVIAETTAHQ